MIQQHYWVVVNEDGNMVPDGKGRATLHTDLDDAEREMRVARRGKRRAAILRVRVIEEEEE